MEKIDSVLIVTHIDHRKSPPYDPIEGPYSSVAQVFQKDDYHVKTLQLPLHGFDNPFLYGQWQNEKKKYLPAFLGKIALLKYIVDFLLITIFLFYYSLNNLKKKNLIVSIDPLSCLPMVFFRKLFGYKLIFYCVDFNKKRFANRFIQFLYEKADYLCSVFSDQVWVVSEVLKEYKKEHYGIDSIYIPNSSIFNRSFYEKGKKYKRGNKIAWTGSFNTNRQIDMLFGVLSKIKTIKPDSEFYLAPINNLTKIKNYIHKHKLIDYKVISVKSRRQWQIKAARYDIGIAVYDHSFGSTQFIEPIKTWDYLLCGMPFIISNKVSICREIKKNNIVYFLDDDNKISNSKSLKQFLNHNYIKKLIPKCVEIARRYDCEKMIIRSITKLN